MEWWERPPSRRGRNKPSFSSSLLDAIYRSIDESDGGGGGPPPDGRKGGAPDPFFSYSSSATAAARKKQSADELRWTAAAVSDRAVIRRGSGGDYNRRIVTHASSSSDSSSYGGCSSSSEAESAAAYYSAGVKPVHSDRMRSGPEVPPEKKKGGSIRSRLRDLRKGRAPTSPGARLASFLNTLFAAVGSPKKPKIAAPPPLESACSSASSYSRSCLSKTPSSRGRRKPPPAAAAAEGGKRSVRFCPVSVVVGEDCRPCGRKCLHDADLAAAAVAGPLPPPAVARRVEELLRGLEREEEEGAISDSSSDLFELENLTGIGRYRNELPVYETTDMGTNHAIARGLAV
ncbi:protein BIG GRAIN 1-like [Phoenix dactylifera]|uniref:Protein BIG GRAIN 1-like n=1 Tax=Phoenix dactylifera TaxID=42345 RepID=A0A8B9AL21_PHODC|nr:protein BIG GRAIN 1-like [Phoenix dactylifera]